MVKHVTCLEETCFEPYSEPPVSYWRFPWLASVSPDKWEDVTGIPEHSSTDSGVLHSSTTSKLLLLSGITTLYELEPPHSRGSEITHQDAPQSVGLLWTSDQPVAETSAWQHSERTTIHAPGGIRTRRPSKRSAVDTRLRPLGHWDWPTSKLLVRILSQVYILITRILGQYFVWKLNKLKVKLFVYKVNGEL